MDSYDHCELWNPEKFWQSEIPIFSPCLRNSYLRWCPSIFLILGFLLQINQYLKRYSDEKVNVFYHLKKLIIFLLLIGSIVELAYFNNFDSGSLYILKTSSSSLELVTYIFVFLLFLRAKNKLRTSCLLLLYSFFLLIASLFRVYSSIAEYYHYREFEDDVERTDESYLIYEIVCLTLVSLFFIFSSCKDSVLPTDSIKCPIYYASFLSRATFWWMNSTIWRGFKHPIKENELWDLHYSNQTNYLYEKFNRYYRKKLEKKVTEKENSPKLDIKIEKNYVIEKGINGNNLNLKNGLRNDKKFPEIDSNEKTQLNGSNLINSESQYNHLLNKPPNVNLVGPLLKTFWKEFIVIAVFRLSALCIQFLNPLILDFLLTYIKSPNSPKWEGVMYGLGMACVMLLFSLANNQYEWRINILGMKIRSILTMAIYKKTLLLSSTGRRIYATGEIVNLMGNDCERIFEFVTMVNQFWACCFQILVSLLMIYYKLGLGFLGALFCLAIVIPWNTFVTRRLKRYQSIEMGYKDDRINMLTEILNGIKCLKLYSWEHSFKEILFKIRIDELTFLRKKLTMQISMIQSYTLVPFLIIFFSLLLHVLIYPDEVLDANKAFVTISLVNILKTPLGLLPFVVSNGVMSKIAVQRINKFLSEDEIVQEGIERTNNSSTKDAILVKKASFIWDIHTDNKPVLKNIHMKVRRKQLVAVIGQVASGKSSLLSALLGEMHRISGEVVINGSVAYVSQQAWILNMTLKDNIVFGNDYNQKKFTEVLEKCQLVPDLKLLANGENTEIGEKGINLSGGQKQRVNIARAVYADKDVYLFDDPLSALDSNVGKDIFDRVIGPNGILKNKTRILVTHKVSLLPKVDRIIVLKNGMVSEIGSFSDLMRTKGDFAEFILQHIENEEFDLDNIDNQEFQDVQKIHQQIRSSMNLPIQHQPIGSRPGSLHNSLRRRKSISSTKSACLNCKTQNRTCYYCERNRQFSESISSRKSFKRKSISSLNKSFDEFDRESILNDGQDEFVEEEKDESKNLVEAENLKAGSVSYKTYKEYLTQFNQSAFFIVLTLYTSAYFFNYKASLWVSEWADDSEDLELAKDQGNRNYRIAIYLLFGLGESAFVLASMIVLSRGCLKAAQKIHNIMLDNISCSPMHYFDSTPMGRILNRFAKDMDVLSYAIWMNLRSFFNSLLKALTSFFIISTQAPTIMLFVLPLLVLYYIFQLVYIRTKRQLVRINLASKSPIYSIYQETINGSNSIRAFNLEDRFCDSCATKIDQNSISFLPTMAVARWLTMRLELLGNLIVLICTIFMVYNREVGPALVGLAITSALTINNSMNNFVRICSELENNIVSVERCIEYTDLEKEDNVPDERSNLNNWPHMGSIKFSDYSTKYRPHLDFVLNNVTFEIKPNEKIGVVGRTGAGKSSLTLALFRIIEASSGSITIDNRKISDLGLYELRSRLTIIPQDPNLFTGSLRLNLDPLNQKGHSDEKLWLALEQAHLKEFVSESNAGLDFNIQESGENLSVGQRQLICLARALLRKSKILVLDEATACVDPTTDELIQATIRKEFNDCTIVTIAHRLNTVMDYDRIVVLDQGRIAEFDSVPNLLANKGIFYGMAKDSGIVS